MHLTCMQHHTLQDLPCLFVFREHGTSEGGISDLHAVLSCTGVVVYANCRTTTTKKDINSKYSKIDIIIYITNPLRAAENRRARIA